MFLSPYYPGHLSKVKGRGRGWETEMDQREKRERLVYERMRIRNKVSGGSISQSRVVLYGI